MNTPPPRSASQWSRRRVLKVVAATLALPLGALAVRGVLGRPGYQSWSGESLGGLASLQLWHENPEFARRAIYQVRAEVERLEGVFSLFRNDSEISRLNRDGRLDAPSADMVEVLTAARTIAGISSGAFDPSVQPLWRLYEQHFRREPNATLGPSPTELAAIIPLIDYRRLDVERRGVRFGQPGMAVTLNGIAQGYITDRVADILAQAGFEHAIVEVGETRAIGGPPEGGSWPVEIQNPQSPTQVARTITIADQAVSVSGGYGTRFGPSDCHHIFDPATGLSASGLLDATVIAPRAMAADGLSTAICVAGEAAAARLLASVRGASAIVTRRDGSSVWI